MILLGLSVFTVMLSLNKGRTNSLYAMVLLVNLMMYIFTIIFAFAIGISTGNFGSLSRYKIPCVPFFASLLLILYYQTQTQAAIKKRTIQQKQLTRVLREAR